MKVLHVVGARPNFMKAAPVMAALAKRNSVSQILVHTGQHYDENMSNVFFGQLGLPEPDLDLGVGSGTHARQTAAIMTRMEEVLMDDRPDLLLVYGDVNSTVAAALTCAKLLIPIGHVEAGLRSFDRAMPEEVNRLITDQLSDLLFTPSRNGDENLLREGIAKEKIHFVGNVMIDTLIRLRKAALEGTVRNQLEEKHPFLADVLRDRYGLVTLHRPSNVDDLDTLSKLTGTLQRISEELPIVFAVHPRTRQRLANMKTESSNPGLFLIDPVGYLEFLFLQHNAAVVITDSGGIQEETTFLDVPCLTVRENTERPVTVDLGTNRVVGLDFGRLRGEVGKILRGDAKKGEIPPLWDGKAGERIAAIITSRG
jgi:UDP-N-acetylglucosamine 2-epimerase (non-hydrolysing)